MDFTFLAEYNVPVIAGLCLCLGYLIKHWIPSADNRIIPTVCGLVGMALAVWMNWPDITPAVLLSGMFSGLAATGVHQANKQLSDIE